MPRRDRFAIVGMATTVLLFVTAIAKAEEPVFSGPQVGEKLPPFSAQAVFGDKADEDIEIVEKAPQGADLLIFFHQRTRPAFGLTNTIMKYAKTRKGLRNTVVFLTEDTTAEAQWVRRVRKNLPEGINYAISGEGIEGPGSYGLNRNVAITLLVAKEGKVTANFALVQPGLQADGPKILKAIVEASGGGKVPTVSEIAGPRYTGQTDTKPPARGENDPKLTGLLRAVINKQAKEEQVKEAAEKVEAYIKTNKNARRELGRITTTVTNSDKLDNYGTEAAQVYLKKWAKEFGAPAGERPVRKRPGTDRKNSDRKDSDKKKDSDKEGDADRKDTRAKEDDAPTKEANKSDKKE
jgi:hypothetical protein